MKLLRLLTAGKSLIGVQQVAGRYRMTDPRAMPKFGEGKNPFKGKTEKVESQPGAALTKPEKAISIAAGKTNGAAAKLAQASLPGAEKNEAVAAAGEPLPKKPELPAAKQPRVEASPSKQSAVKASGPKHGWASKISSLKKLLRRDAARAAKAARELRPVQGELSLEKIKVMRNDLSESDLEVVTRRPAAAKQAAVESRLPTGNEAMLAMAEAGRS